MRVHSADPRPLVRARRRPPASSPHDGGGQSPRFESVSSPLRIVNVAAWSRCINLGSSAASSLAALLSFAFFAGANGLVVLSLVKANDFTLVFWAVLAFLVLLITLLNAVFIVATMLPGLKLVAFFVAQARFLTWRSCAHPVPALEPCVIRSMTIENRAAARASNAFAFCPFARRSSLP